MKTFATLFSGCGGSDVGLRAAGLQHLWSVENNPKAARIAMDNGFKSLIEDVRTVDYSTLRSPDWLHISPPCQRASVANSKQGETTEDMNLATATANAINALRPHVVTLENVQGYQSFDSFWHIKNVLAVKGYTVVEMVLDAANYGVPQNRKRLWMVASRIGQAKIPATTHEDPAIILPQLFGEYERSPWVSWDKALSDIPLIDDVLSDRMLSALPSNSFPRSLCTGFKDSEVRSLTMRPEGTPAPTIIASMDRPSLMPWAVERRCGVTTAQRLDVQHMAALQSFPIDYRWGEDLTAARCAIGNAVAPLQMKAIAQANLPSSFANWVKSEQQISEEVANV